MIDIQTPVIDIKLNQKASFSMRIQITNASGQPAPIADWNFVASIKGAFKDATPITDFTVTKLADSWIKLSLTAAQTALLSKPVPYKYDLVALDVSPDPDETYRVVQGSIEAYPGVSTV
jgi:hypothetical protein